MRISIQMMYQQNVCDITNSQAEWVKFDEQVSTGKRAINPSDGPIVASQAAVLPRTQTQNSQYTLTRLFATRKVPLEKNVLSQVTMAIQATREKVVYAGNGTLGDDDRTSPAADLQGIRDRPMNLANSTNGNGRYIFGGYKTESVPFTQVDGACSGGTTNVTQQINASQTIVISRTGDKVFTSLASNAVSEPSGGIQEENPFKMLDTAIGALKAPIEGNDVVKTTVVVAIDKASRGLKNSLNNVLSVRAELGMQLSELSSLNSLGADRALGQAQQMSNLVDVDWSAAISSYVVQQAALQASYKASTDMQGMPLFQLNR